MKKIRVSLLTKVVIAIAAGVLFGQFYREESHVSL